MLGMTNATAGILRCAQNDGERSDLNLTIAQKIQPKLTAHVMAGTGKKYNQLVTAKPPTQIAIGHNSRRHNAP